MATNSDLLLQMELLDEKGGKAFLEQSGYRRKRNMMFNSMSLREYLELLDEKFSEAAKVDPSKEIELVDRYVKLVEENKHSVSIQQYPDPNLSVPGESDASH